MDSNFMDAVRNAFEDLLIDIEFSNLRRTELGFVNSDCNMVKSMLGSLCVHALNNPDIFTEEQANNIIGFINNLSHG